MKTRALKTIAIGEFVLILGMLALPARGWAQVLLKPPQAEDRPAQIQGVNIHYAYERAQFFPTAWLTAEVNCQGVQVAAPDAERAVPLIQQFLAAYDSAVIRNNLTDIYLLGDLNCYGQPYGGTNSTSSVYVRVGTRASGYTDRIVLSTTHEEFSSILFRKYVFPRAAWQSLNGDYGYPNDSTLILDEPGLRSVAPDDLLASGFLTSYAASSMENDFNEYAGWLFVWPDQLCGYSSMYPAIEKKAMLASAFYKSIQPDMEAWGCEWDPSALVRGMGRVTGQ